MNFWSWVNLFPSFYRDKHAHNHPTIYHYLWWITGGAWNDLLYSKKKQGPHLQRLSITALGRGFRILNKISCFCFQNCHLTICSLLYMLYFYNTCVLYICIFSTMILYIFVYQRPCILQPSLYTIIFIP